MVWVFSSSAEFVNSLRIGESIFNIFSISHVALCKYEQNLFIYFNLCDVVEVAIIHMLIEPNLAIRKIWKEKILNFLMYFLATYLSHVRNLVDLFLNSIFGGFFFCLEKQIPIFFPTIFPWAWHLMPSCPCHVLGSPPIFNLQIVPKFGFPILSISNFYNTFIVLIQTKRNL